MKKFISAAVCAVLSVVSMCSCSSDDELNVAMEDLEYGATMRQLADTDIKICYDGRYFTDDEMRVVVDYYNAVQLNDVELFKKTQSEPYVTYLEKNSGQTIDNFLENIYQETVSSLGDEFEYTYIEAVNGGGRNDDLEIDEIIDLMNSVYEENGSDKTFEETVNDAKFATLDFTAESGGSQFTYSGQTIYIFNCTDGIYIFN
ncbi:MAG: hypothetical protein ACI4JB_11780 [Porcipelethomonas sp.]